MPRDTRRPLWGQIQLNWTHDAHFGDKSNHQLDTRRLLWGQMPRNTRRQLWGQMPRDKVSVNDEGTAIVSDACSACGEPC